MSEIIETLLTTSNNKEILYSKVEQQLQGDESLVPQSQHPIAT